MDPRLDSSSVAMMNSELLNRLWLGMVSLILILSSGAVEGINFTFNSFKSLSDVYTVPNGSQWSYSLSDSSLYLEPSINSVAGRFLYPHLVQMMDPKTMSANSFSCNFIFQIFMPDVNGGHTGSGMTFMIVPDNSTVGGALDYMGLLTDSLTTDSNLHTFAVEFDTHMNPEFNDPNDNHVGIDLRVMNSTAIFIPPFRLAQGSPEVYHQVWIDYFQAPDSRMDLYISQYGEVKPTMPFSTFVDLSFLNEYMYVGFSAAQSDNVHKILAWSFSTDGPAPPIWINTIDLAPSPSSRPISGLEPSETSPAGAVRLIVGLICGIVGIICFGIMILCFREHEIFSHPRRPVRFLLAHSAGEDCAGKNFAERLYRELKSTWRCQLDLITVFFDRGSLGWAEDFPEEITRELNRTHVGVVIVTEEFFQNKWPMTELLSFVRRRNEKMRILPLFYRLDVHEVRSRLRARAWDERWREMYRLNVEECRAAVQILCDQHGIQYNARDRSHDSRYIEEILEAVAEISDEMRQEVNS